ncbi:MAG: hypothetical protein HYR64_01235 [Fimbriimonas ginsengisoli]|uniref:Uncharacterized protein n=1 Tax=Fimbriimonas ginsengisoli TaxID=1005039 RepID=A0A931PUZ7_FIMGI|nr:hypothetical protein [Fimbriimonas ginsengisoli]
MPGANASRRTVWRHGSEGEPQAEVAPQLAGLEPNAFGGLVGPYRYQFEGEDDLLHLIVVRRDLGALEPEEGQSVAAFLLEGVPQSLIWLKPARLSQHFYLGHDVLLESLTL